MVSKTSNPQTRNIMSIYEKTALLGTRMQQLISGSPTTLTAEELNELTDKSPKGIAYSELEKKKIPMKLCRNLPNGTKEYWDISDLRIL